MATSLLMAYQGVQSSRLFQPQPVTVTAYSSLFPPPVLVAQDVPVIAHKSAKSFSANLDLVHRHDSQPVSLRPSSDRRSIHENQWASSSTYFGRSHRVDVRQLDAAHSSHDTYMSSRQQAHDINTSHSSSLQTTRVSAHQIDVEAISRDAGPKCKVDSTTDIPEDLFEALLKRGKERRKAGQHVLVARSQKSGGGVKLVAAERVAHGKPRSNMDSNFAAHRAGA